MWKITPTDLNALPIWRFFNVTLVPHPALSHTHSIPHASPYAQNKDNIIPNYSAYIVQIGDRFTLKSLIRLE